jgi:ABC-type branched-subunit amino acid transport system permease subunit
MGDFNDVSSRITYFLILTLCAINIALLAFRLARSQDLFVAMPLIASFLAVTIICFGVWKLRRNFRELYSRDGRTKLLIDTEWRLMSICLMALLAIQTLALRY